MLKVEHQAESFYIRGWLQFNVQELLDRRLPKHRLICGERSSGMCRDAVLPALIGPSRANAANVLRTSAIEMNVVVGQNFMRALQYE